MDMKFKENCGLDPVSLGKGYTKLDGDPPYSGENIMAPEHVAEAESFMGMPDDASESAGGFLEREIPARWLRTRRSDDDDQG